MTPKLPPGLPSDDERRRPAPRERHSLAVHLMATRLVVMCKCGSIVGGNRQDDVKVISLYDLVELTTLHAHQQSRR